MTLYQLQNGYRYNSDTIFLADFIAGARVSGRVLDAGCGILGLLLKDKYPKIDLTSLDIQSINCDITRKNSEINSLENSVICSDFASFYKDFDAKCKFDMIVSNPPFYPSNSTKSQNEHINLSRYSENLSFKDMLKSVNAIIKPKGSFCFCYDARSMGSVIHLLLEHKFSPTRLRIVHSKIDKESKLALFEAKKGSNSSCKVFAPLVVFDGENFSKEAVEIFDKFKTQSKIYG